MLYPAAFLKKNYISSTGIVVDCDGDGIQNTLAQCNAIYRFVNCFVIIRICDG